MNWIGLLVCMKDATKKSGIHHLQQTIILFFLVLCKNRADAHEEFDKLSEDLVSWILNAFCISIGLCAIHLPKVPAENLMIPKNFLMLSLILICSDFKSDHWRWYIALVSYLLKSKQRKILFEFSNRILLNNAPFMKKFIEAIQGDDGKNNFIPGYMKWYSKLWKFVYSTALVFK